MCLNNFFFPGGLTAWCVLAKTWFSYGTITWRGSRERSTVCAGHALQSKQLFLSPPIRPALLWQLIICLLPIVLSCFWHPTTATCCSYKCFELPLEGRVVISLFQTVYVVVTTWNTLGHCHSFCRLGQIMVPLSVVPLKLTELLAENCHFGGPSSALGAKWSLLIYWVCNRSTALYLRTFVNRSSMETELFQHTETEKLNARMGSSSNWYSATIVSGLIEIGPPAK